MDPNMRMKLIQNLMELLEGLPDKEEKPEGGELSVAIEPKSEGECAEPDADDQSKMKVIPGKGM